jgi:uncharacterized DUF497 family protein
MANSEFEWDNRKAAANFAKHGVSFDKAREVFDDPFAVDRLDDRADYGEQRFVIIGMVDGRLLFVSYTMRGDNIRIISARGAEPREQRQYHEDQK